MCGIAGFCLSPDEHDVNPTVLAANLLLEIEHRGRDATGVGWFMPSDYHVKTEQNRVWTQKAAVPAKEFVKKLTLPAGTRNAILHTRAATQGPKEDNNNNHPVWSNGIVGVHNGMVWNDDALFRRMDIQDHRVGQVDTEAIFAAIGWGRTLDENNKPRLRSTLTACLEEIEGSAAIAWITVEGDPGVMEVARINQSPFIWGQTKAGSFLFASTKFALETAAQDAGLELVHMEDMAEGVYMKINQGRIDEVERFVPAAEFYGHGYWTGGTTTYRPKTKGSTASTYVTGGGKLTPLPDGQAGDPNIGKHGTKRDMSAWTNVDAKLKNIDVASTPTDEDDVWMDPAEMLAMTEMLTSFSFVPGMDSDMYSAVYEERELAIDDVMNDKTMGLTESTDLIRELHGYVRPGDWVHTHFNGKDDVPGQVLAMPNDWPGNMYLVRVCSVFPDRENEVNYEYVLVMRHGSEFKLIPRELNPPTPPAVSSEDPDDAAVEDAAADALDAEVAAEVAALQERIDAIDDRMKDVIDGCENPFNFSDDPFDDDEPVVISDISDTLRQAWPELDTEGGATD